MPSRWPTHIGTWNIDEVVRAVIDRLASPIEGADLRFLVKK
jgi:hypothetical protein